MPNSWRDVLSDNLCSAFAGLSTREEVYAFLEDIASIKEIRSMSQRLEVARLLSEGKKYPEVVSLTGASTATISRVKKCLEYGAGGYESVLKSNEHGRISQSQT